jgi:hypothetical protein
LGCDLLQDTGIGEQTAPGRDNPFDPQNDTNELSSLTLSGEYTFGEVFTIHEDQLSLGWEADTSGVNTSLQFRFKYAGPDESLADQSYGDYFTEFELTISNLRESLGSEKVHQMEIELSSSVNDNLEPKTFQVSFLVDKIQSIGFAFQKANNSDQDSSFEIPIWVDELSNISEINGFRLDLILNSTEVDAGSTTVNIFSDSSSPFYWEGGSIFTLTKQNGDTLRIESAIASGSNINEIVRAKLGSITIELIESVNTTSLEISSSSYFQLRSGEKIHVVDLDLVKVVN